MSLIKLPLSCACSRTPQWLWIHVDRELNPRESEEEHSIRGKIWDSSESPVQAFRGLFSSGFNKVLGRDWDSVHTDGTPKSVLNGCPGSDAHGNKRCPKKNTGLSSTGVHLARVLQTLWCISYVPAMVSNVGDADRNAVQLTPFVSCCYSVCGYGAMS